MEVHSEPNLLVHTSEESLQPNQAQHVRLSIIKNSDTFNAFLTRGTNFELNSHISGLDPTGRTMIIAISANVDAPDDGSSESEDGDWIGTLSVLSPRKLAQDPRDKPLPPHVMVMFSSGKLKLYMIIGVWVHAEHRRRGIGRLMVEYALEMISLDPVRPTSSRFLLNYIIKLGLPKGPHKR